jgi:hypothetical protein
MSGLKSFSRDASITEQRQADYSADRCMPGAASSPTWPASFTTPSAAAVAVNDAGR